MLSALAEDPRLRKLARRLPPVVPAMGLRALRVAALPGAWAHYLRGWRHYRELPGAAPLRLRDADPKLTDRVGVAPFDPHYFRQDIWAARQVAALAPDRHVDVGSRIELVGFLTVICPVTFVDIRPLEVEVTDLHMLAGSILDLPFEDRSIPSLSCLHVAEHIGLGRYGDPLDPDGSRRAAAELQRVLAPGGELLFSGPVGAPRVCFNAHRVHDPLTVLEWFDELDLVGFAGIDDDSRFSTEIAPADLRGQRYACGMYRFRRP